ncbi:MAG: CPBP family intramembrane glutamic endopeptidase [Chthoniobacterales bacterium]
MKVPTDNHSKSFLCVSGLRLRPLPLAVVVLLGLFLPLPGQITALSLSYRLFPVVAHEMPWVPLFIGHAVTLLVTLAAIAVMKRFVPGDFGLCWPHGKTYVAAALTWGLFFGLLMTFIDFAPQIATRQAPQGAYSLTPLNLIGWLAFEGLFAGFPEEILYRGLLVTFLVSKVPGRIALGRYEMNIAGVIIAFIFALAHVGSFWVHPFWIALGQQVYAFALGVLYAYWFEKSGSLLAPIVGHNMGNFLETVLTFCMVAVLR